MHPARGGKPKHALGRSPGRQPAVRRSPSCRWPVAGVVRRAGGACYGLAFQLSGSLSVAILLHFLFNFAHLALFTYPWPATDVEYRFTGKNAPPRGWGICIHPTI